MCFGALKERAAWRAAELAKAHAVLALLARNGRRRTTLASIQLAELLPTLSLRKLQP